MNKILKFLSVFLIFTIIFSFVNLINADDLNDVDLEQSEDLIIEQDLADYSSTNYAMKIRLTQLENTVNFKIEQLQIIIDKLNENEISTEELETNLGKFIVLSEELKVKSDVDEIIDAKETTTYFISTKQESVDLMQNCRQYLLENVPEHIVQETREEVHNYRKEIKVEQKEKMKNLVKEHNLAIRNKYKKIFSDIKESQSGDTNKSINALEIRNRIKEQTKNKILESKNSFVQNQKMQILENKEKIEKYKQKRLETFNKYKDSNNNPPEINSKIKNIRNNIRSRIANRNNNNNGDIE
jgi:hypothetical protein